MAYLRDVILEHCHVEAGKAVFDSTYVKRRKAADELAYIAYEEHRRVAALKLARHIRRQEGSACNS